MYEQKHFPIDIPDPVAAITFRMQQQGPVDADLDTSLGRCSGVSEVLNKKRKLSINMIRKWHKNLGIPLHRLILDYALVRQ